MSKLGTHDSSAICHSDLEVDDGLFGDGCGVRPLLLCVDLVDGVLDLGVRQQVARRVTLLQLPRPAMISYNGMFGYSETSYSDILLICIDSL